MASWSSLDDVLGYIRTRGVEGPAIREAIGDAISIADSSADARIGQIRQQVTNEIRMETTKIEGTSSDYLLTITNP